MHIWEFNKNGISNQWKNDGLSIKIKIISQSPKLKNIPNTFTLKKAMEENMENFIFL